MSDSISDGSLHPGDYSPKPTKAARPRVEPIPVLDAAEQVTVQVDLLREQYDSIRRLCQANGWKEQEGLLTVLMSGVGYLDANLQVESINRSEEAGELAGRVDGLVQDLASYHSMYAVMKFKAFKMYKLNQTLEFNVAGLRATERMWEEWAERMRKEQAELRTEILRLKAVMSEFDVRTRTEDGGSEVRKFDDVLPFIVPALQHHATPADDYSAWERGNRPALAEEASHSADTIRLLPASPAGRPRFWARVVERCKAWFR
jgi:hypothetical protein